jgi:hypothetical protein
MSWLWNYLFQWLEQFSPLWAVISSPAFVVAVIIAGVLLVKHRSNLTSVFLREFVELLLAYDGWRWIAKMMKASASPAFDSELALPMTAAGFLFAYVLAGHTLRVIRTRE